MAIKRNSAAMELAGVIFCGCAVALAGAARAADLDLSGYKLVFEENFSNLSVSSRGPGTRWIAHTPWNGDFGNAEFVDPQPDFPFIKKDGVFNIEVRQLPNGHWQSGLLCSVDQSGQGFKILYGYVEMRAKLPAGNGMWPAFWLNSIPPRGSQDTGVEIDVMEQYGRFPRSFNTTINYWPKPGHYKQPSQMYVKKVPEGSLYADYHRYGVAVTPLWLIFYFDGTEYWRSPTPLDYRYPSMILIDLGLGGGWPITRAPSPAFMAIDYVRAYAPLK